MNEQEWKNKMEENLELSISNAKFFKTSLKVHVVANIMVILAVLIYILS